MRFRFLWLSALAIAAPPIAFGAYAGALALSGNFGTVEPGLVYRSAQPNAAAIRAFAAREGHGSIINLRGPAFGRPWYEDEVVATHDNGLAHFDFAMSADREISPDEAHRLIALIAEAPKPVLIHCHSGADRTGLAAALYLHAVGDADRAGRQLSLLYGHFPYLWSRTGAMDASLAAYLGDAALVEQRAEATLQR